MVATKRGINFSFAQGLSKQSILIVPQSRWTRRRQTYSAQRCTAEGWWCDRAGENGRQRRINVSSKTGTQNDRAKLVISVRPYLPP